jgi:hypothetical protein
VEPSGLKAVSAADSLRPMARPLSGDLRGLIG